MNDTKTISKYICSQRSYRSACRTLHQELGPIYILVSIFALYACNSPAVYTSTNDQNVCIRSDSLQQDHETNSRHWPIYPSNPYVIIINQPVEKHGSIFVHDVNGDSLMDFVVTSPGIISTYDNSGCLIWRVNDDIRFDRADKGNGYPGTWAPAAIASDMDGDGETEVAYVTRSGLLKILSGTTGAVKKSYRFPDVEAIAPANFRGLGDRDAILQFSQEELAAVNLETGNLLWRVDDWMGIEHSMARTADIDHDGRDEVLGPVILDDDGSKRQTARRNPGTLLKRMDSLVVGDIIPGDGIEIAVGEQGGNNETIVLGADQVYWGKHHSISSGFGECLNHFDPDKLAVGDFDPARNGLEVFARSSCGNFPWVMDSSGNIISTWKVADVAPPGWCHHGDCETGKPEGEYGIDLVRSITWDGSDTQQLLLQERRNPAKVAIVDALTGEFLQVWDVDALRSYAADITGDYREEVIIIEKLGKDSSRIVVFTNNTQNLKTRDRLWNDDIYRRVRQNWNYYSP